MGVEPVQRPDFERYPSLGTDLHRTAARRREQPHPAQDAGGAAGGDAGTARDAGRRAARDEPALHRARDPEPDRTAGRLSAARGAARPFSVQAGRRLSRRRGGTADRRRSWRKRSEEHTSELQSLMRISYAVFCLKKKTYI